MALKSTVDTIDAVPEALREFYAEKDGKFVLQAEGLSPTARVNEFRENNLALKREMDELRARFDGIDPDNHRELAAQAQKIKERKLIDAGKLDELVAERTAAMKADYEKQIGSGTATQAALTRQLEALVVDNALRDAAAKASVRPTAVEDFLLRGKQLFRLQDGKAVPFDGDKAIYGKDGEPLSMSEWAGSLSERAPHLFETSTGTGATGSTGAAATGGKTMTRAQFEALGTTERMAAAKGGIKLAD
jgi:hypothetical protein